MKICFASDYLPNYHKTWGGAEQAAYSLLKLLVQNGCQLTMLSKRPIKEPKEDFDYFRVPVLEDFLPEKAKRFVEEAKAVLLPVDPISFISSYRILRKIRPAVLHLHGIRSLSLSLILAAKRLGIPVIYSAYDFWYLCPMGTLYKESERCTGFHGFQCGSCIRQRRKVGFITSLLLSLPLFFRKKLFDYFSKKIDAFVVLSNTWAEIFHQYGIEKAKISIVPLPLFKDGEAEVGESKVEDRSILFVGWVKPHKGLHVLIEAMPEIMREVPEVKLYVIETGVDNDYKSQIMNSVKDYAIEQSVVFLGKRTHKDVQTFIQKAEVVAVPEQWGIAWPIFLTEAMSWGKPVVASRIGDIPQFIQNGKNGFLEDPGNSLEFAKKIVWILKEKEAAAKMGKQAREDVIRMCDENRISDELEKVYLKHSKNNAGKKERGMKSVMAGLFDLFRIVMTGENIFPNYLLHFLRQEAYLLRKGKFRSACNYAWVMAFSREEGVGLAEPLYKYSAKLVPYPKRIELEVTTRCRFQCPKCEHTYWDQEQKDMSFEQFREIIDQFPNLREVSLTGIGHGLENEEYLKMLRYLKSKSIFVQFFDPLLLVNEEVAKELIRIGVDWIWMSIDGTSKKTYERSIAGSNFATVVNNARDLIRLKREMGSAFPELHFQFIVTKYNVHEMPDLVDLAGYITEGEKLMHMIQFIKLIPFERNRFLTPEVNQDNTSEVKKRLKKHKNLAVRLYYRMSSSPRPISDCTHWTVPFITVDGNYYPCCALTERNMRRQIEEEFDLDNLFEKPFKDIWYSEKQKGFRLMINQGKVPAICNFITCPLIYGD